MAWIETITGVGLAGKDSSSPPARVAWIETFEKTIIFSVVFVATREGGVDRNIFCPPVDFILLSVATREGGVDRNTDSSLHL